MTPAAPPRFSFLIDSHLPRALATSLSALGHDAQHLADWRSGILLNASDAELLTEAGLDERTIITYDSATLPLDAYALLDAGTPFAGVLVLTRSIGQRDIGGQVRAILHALASRTSLAGLVLFVQPADQP